MDVNAETFHNTTEMSNIDEQYQKTHLFFMKNSEIIKENDCDSNLTVNINNSKKSIVIYSTDKYKAAFKITKCAYDEDGDLCDVRIWTDNITNKTTDKGIIDGYKNIKYQLLIQPWKSFDNSNYVSAYLGVNVWGGDVRVNIQYYKTGTTTPAKLSKLIGKVSDIDYYNTAYSEQFRIEKKTDTILYKDSTAKDLTYINSNNQLGAYKTNANTNGCEFNNPKGIVYYKTSFTNAKTYPRYNIDGENLDFKILK